MNVNGKGKAALREYEKKSREHEKVLRAEFKPGGTVQHKFGLTAAELEVLEHNLQVFFIWGSRHAIMLLVGLLFTLFMYFSCMLLFCSAPLLLLFSSCISLLLSSSFISFCWLMQASRKMEASWLPLQSTYPFRHVHSTAICILGDLLQSDGRPGSRQDVPQARCQTGASRTCGVLHNCSAASQAVRHPRRHVHALPAAPAPYYDGSSGAHLSLLHGRPHRYAIIWLYCHCWTCCCMAPCCWLHPSLIQTVTNRMKIQQ